MSVAPTTVPCAEELKNQLTRLGQTLGCCRGVRGRLAHLDSAFARAHDLQAIYSAMQTHSSASTELRRRPKMRSERR